MNFVWEGKTYFWVFVWRWKCLLCEITLLIALFRDEDKCEKRGFRKHFDHLNSSLFTCIACKHWFLNYQSESLTRLKIVQQRKFRRDSQTLHCVLFWWFLLAFSWRSNSNSLQTFWQTKWNLKPLLSTLCVILCVSVNDQLLNWFRNGLYLSRQIEIFHCKTQSHGC